MSTIFRAIVESKTYCVVDVRVYIVHPQQFEFYESKSFAIGLLYDAVIPRTRSIIPLSKAISLELLFDNEWVVSRENDFIEKIEIVETFNYPVMYEWKNMTEEEQLIFFKDANQSKQACAIYRIEVTDPKWIEMLYVGYAWDSAAYDHSEYL